MVRRYKIAASLLRGGDGAAPVELLGKFVVVDCEETSRKLLGVAGELWKGALQWVHFTLGRLAGEGTTIPLQISKVYAIC